MIERLLEKSDFNKIFEDAKAKEYFIELLQNEEYLEIVEDKTVFLGLRSQSGCEVLQIEDSELLNFFRLVRDDFHDWRELISIRRSAHKQLLQSFLKNSFYHSLKDRLEKTVLSDSVKLCKKIHTVNDRMESLHQRLQGVFLVEGKRKELLISMDSRKTTIVCKYSEETNIDLLWTKDIKYARAFLVIPDEKTFAKEARTVGFERLQQGRKKSKNIWVKNHK